MSPKEDNMTSLVHLRCQLYFQIKSGATGGHHVRLGVDEQSTANKSGIGEKFLAGTERRVQAVMDGISPLMTTTYQCSGFLEPS